MIATFIGNPKLSIISCYSPTNVVDEETAIELYNELASLIRQIVKHNMKIVAGDFNAKIGSDRCKGYCLYEKTDRNGQILLELMSECKLMDLNTHFKKKQGKL